MGTNPDDYVEHLKNGIPQISFFEVKECSSHFKRAIARHNKNNVNNLPDRKTRLPFHKLEVGQSIWIDMDNEHPFNVNSARLSCNWYTSIYDIEFKWMKHRGDARRSGFKFLEIARIR